MSSTPRESSYQGRIVEIIEAAGGYGISTTRLAPVKRGIPDLWYVLRGVTLCIEIKGPSTPHKALQHIQRQRIREAGGVSFVARGDDGVELVKRVVEIIVNWSHAPGHMHVYLDRLELPQ